MIPAEVYEAAQQALREGRTVREIVEIVWSFARPAPVEFALSRARQGLPVGPLTRGERTQVVAALAFDGWSHPRMARALGVAESTIYRHLPINTEDGDRLVSLKYAGFRLGVSDCTIRNWIKAGRVRGYRVGSLWRIDRTDLEALVVSVCGSGVA